MARLEESTSFDYLSENLQHRVLQDLRKHFILEEHLLAVYIIGSTLWGTRNQQSDYDLYVIHNSDAKQVKGNKISVSSGDFDMQLCHFDEFQARLKNHELSAVLLKYHPNELMLFNRNDEKAVSFILPEQKELLSLLLEEHELSHAALCASVCKEAHKDWLRVAKLLTNNCDFHHGVKVAIHAIRSFLLSIQLIEHEEVVDWKCANKHYNELLGASFDNLGDYLNSHLEPLFDSYKCKLINTAKPPHNKPSSVSVRTSTKFTVNGGVESVQFSKYEKMQHSSVKCIGEKMKGQYVVTEKVHGANFSIICKGVNGTVVYGRRTGLISEGEDFYGYLSNKIPEQYSPRARELFKNISLHDSFKSSSKKKSDTFCADIEQIQIIGELFGGYYPSQEKSLLGPVQTGIWYTHKLEFMVFDIAVTFVNGDRTYLDFHMCKQLAEQAGFLFVPVLFIGAYEKAVTYPNRFSSKVPGMLGLPPIQGAEENLAEGVVIKCCEENIHTSFKARVIFKHKIDEFSEKKYMTSRAEFKQNLDKKKTDSKDKAAEEKRNFNQTEEEKLDMLKFEMWACLTESRLQAVLSKIGFVNWNDKEKCLEVLKLYVQDIIADLDSEEQALFKSLDVQTRKDLVTMLREDVKQVIKQWAKNTRN